jgi:hypothetical protein
MYAGEKRSRYIRRWIGLVLFGLVVFWYVALPRVVVYYAKDGTSNINYVLNTKHTIVRGELLPGETTGDVGHIFPDDEFFMMLDWWNDMGLKHCIYIAPKWLTTEIHLDRNGDIDQSKASGTDADRLTPCAVGSKKS